MELGSIVGKKFLKKSVIALKMIQCEKIKLFFGVSDFNFIKDIKLLTGGKNNRVLKIQFKNKEKVILKDYFFSKSDRRDRLKTEWTFLKHTQKLKCKNVPIPLQINENLNMASYSYISGKSNNFKKIRDQDIIDCAKFIVEINQIPIEANFLPASESCETLESHNFNINKRVMGLSYEIDKEFFLGKKIIEFIHSEIIPFWIKIKNNNIKNSLNINKKTNLFLSPSDFGFHNIIKNTDDTLFFIDFEYSGIDDLVKLSNDFFFSSNNKVKKKQKEIFLSYLENNLDLDYNFRRRVHTFEFAYRLKWLCIMLNQYSRNGILKNKFTGNLKSKAEHEKYFDKIKILFRELEKDFLIKNF